KSISTDIRLKKKTLPVVYLLEKARGAASAHLLEIYQKDLLDNEDVHFVLDLMNSLDAHGHAREVSRKFLKQALAELDRISLSTAAREELQAVATFLLERES
ncbi:MAG: hypothetical protein IBX68_09625, partial [Dehalococcoidia bacterium]|nr:hypothetical protein [Dehalococcoidia bacterium]